ncbi:ribonuclease III [Atractiella rhizophila]|nr:ribonuclease III [Atractiella rhizophila]
MRYSGHSGINTIKTGHKIRYTSTKARIDSSLGQVIHSLSPELRKQAFTHGSIDPSNNYELLEHIGDAVLCTVVTLLIHEKYPEMSLTERALLRSKSVEASAIYQLSVSLGFSNQIQHHPDMKLSERVIGDVFEAVVGALMLEKGFQFTSEWLKGVYDEFLDANKEMVTETLARQPKIEKLSQPQPQMASRPSAEFKYQIQLHNLSQVQDFNLRYRTVEQVEHPHHLWREAVEIDGEEIAIGESSRRSLAREMAAKRALEVYQAKPKREEERFQNDLHNVCKKLGISLLYRTENIGNGDSPWIEVVEIGGKPIAIGQSNRRRDSKRASG